jgi:hypothetical protein
LEIRNFTYSVTAARVSGKIRRIRVAKRYIQTIPNPNNNGPRVGIFYPDTELGREHPDAIEFASKWDVPGQAVYDAINLFKDDATERKIETAAEYERISCDVDLKDIEEPADKVVDALTKLVYPPSEIRHSGHGIHADWNLKERLSAATDAAAVKAARARLSDFLCADASINHDAALLRRCGTTNSKDPANPIICRTVAATGHTTSMTLLMSTAPTRCSRARRRQREATEEDHGSVMLRGASRSKRR